MKSKKGFTLLEVLLVIDILVIISMIAIPIVMNNIDNARRKSFEQDVNSVFRSAEINLRTTVPNEKTCYSLGHVDVSYQEKFLSGMVCKDSNHNYEVKNLCTKDYCYNGDLETGTQVDSYIDKLPMIKVYPWETTIDFHHADYKNNIVSIEVLTTKTVPSNAVKSWDVSASGNGSVMAWVVENAGDNTKYDLFIGGEGGVKANPNSSNMFMDIINVKTIDLENFYTHDVTTLKNIFRGCNNLETINISSFNTSKVVNMVSMFYLCYKLKSIDVSGFDTRNVDSMQGMFNGCCALTSLNLSNFNTSKVIDFGWTFCNLQNIKNIDLSNFDTSNVTNMQGMFHKCHRMESLDLSNFNTSNVTIMVQMFSGCYSLKQLDLSHFNTSKVNSMYRMFHQCKKLENLNISNFNTSNVINMQEMFFDLYKIPYLNLKSFNTAKATKMDYMFNWTGALNKIDVTSGQWVTAQANPVDMFKGCKAGGVTYN